jgi:putative tryptophan/tyrosine transport system substrate-binding protein
MRRREFIALLSGSAAWPLMARAQQADRMRRVGVLMAYGETDPEAKALLAEFTQGLSELGWTDGRNLRLDVRWAPGNTDAMRTYAKELVTLQPDVILANSTPVTATFQRETQTIPIVFSIVADLVGFGFVASLPRPGGNITGFGSVETCTGDLEHRLFYRCRAPLRSYTAKTQRRHGHHTAIALQNGVEPRFACRKSLL